MSNPRSIVAALAVLTLTAAPAMAHPKLVSSTPAADAAVAPTSTVTLSFSETLEPKFSGVDLTQGDKPVVGAVTKVDRKTITVSLKAPLPAGAYKVAWHATSTDTHKLRGVYAFTVK